MQSWLSQRYAINKADGKRQLIWLAGEPDWAWSLITPWLTQFERNMYVGESDPTLPCVTCVKPNKPNTLLGYESHNVVFDGHYGLYPDALTAISGTLLPGGFLFFITPALNDYPTFSDTFAQSRTSFGFEQHSNNARTIKRLLESAKLYGARIIEQGEPKDDSSQAHLIADTAIAHPQWVNALKNKKKRQTASSYTTTDTAITPNQDQATVFAKIIAHFDHSHMTALHRPKTRIKEPKAQVHVITADRGRGKSHLLGMLANLFSNSLKDNGIKYFLCAPNKTACHAVYQHLTPATRDALVFVAPENLLTQANTTDVIFIDEAASLPIGQLMAWANHFKRIVMATTTHGYEGTGKGFQIRFFHHLDTLKNQQAIIWHHHTLKQPIRYHEHDPVEQWLFDSLCLNCEPNAQHLSRPTIKKALDTLTVEYVPKDTLSTSPQLLKHVFSLLVKAHYQTKPSDLRDLLDAPTVHLFAQFITINNQQQVIGVCLINDEGPLENTTSEQQTSDLHHNILNGYRRPKGHLIPQVIAHHMGILDGLSLKGARIVRIATLENAQRLGCGSQLLNAIKYYCQQHQYDYLGSSFADTQDVRLFWLKNNFKFIRKGHKQDKASGTQSALVIQGISKKGNSLEHNTVAIYEQLHKIISINELGDTQRILLNAFLNHNGSYESAKVILNSIKYFEWTWPKKANTALKQAISAKLSISDNR